jgi:imidazole glycerol-phosphate synthase subunit HisH
VIAIVDYGAGNLASVRKAFGHLGAETVVTDRVDVLAVAQKIVLPGVGHFSTLSALELKGLRSLLLGSIRAGKPFLGICLGMQWLFEGSEECPEIAGASLLKGACRKFPDSVQSPHVGWNSLEVRDSSRLLKGLAETPFVYYTHSFYAPVVGPTAGRSEYGLPFTGAVEQGNVFGVQFHPEKSGEVGLQILKNFCEVR